MENTQSFSNSVSKLAPLSLVITALRVLRVPHPDSSDAGGLIYKLESSPLPVMVFFSGAMGTIYRPVQ